MKKLVTTISLLAIFIVATAQSWQPAGDRIKTQWAEEVNPENPLPEYPRPQLVRDQWLNLNGLWDYAILERGRNMPAFFDRKILVPYTIEFSLSSVQKRMGENHELWYHRMFTIPPAGADLQLGVFGRIPKAHDYQKGKSAKN